MDANLQKPAASSKYSVKDVDGYIHKVSDVKNPASGYRYFDFKVQERDDEKRVVCFSPEKRDKLKEKELSNEPVTLQNVSPQKRKFQPDLTEYKMNNYSKVVVKRNVTFPWKDIAKERANATIKYVLDNCDTAEIVSLKGKVVSKSEEDMVFSSKIKKDLRNCDVVFGDSTGAIIVTLWEDAIDKVEEQKSYLFSNFKVAYYKKKYLNSTPTSDIKEEWEDVELCTASQKAADELKPKEKLVETIIGSIVAVEAKKLLTCINCSSKLADTSEDAKVITCSGCNLTMRKASLQANVYANILVKNEDEEMIGRFYASSSTLNGMFTSLAATENYNITAEKVTELSAKMITETLLLVEKVLFEIIKEDKVIQSMQVMKQE
jgi:hypothetical protein